MLIKTTNFEAGSVYAVMNGTREHYDTTPAAITDSLFMDYMLQNGLSVKNGKTYDLITLKFNYGTRSYDEERKRIEKMDMDAEKKQFFLDQCDKNKDLYDKKSVDQIRTIFYNNGLDINWGKTTIHYVMLFRSQGYAKIGQCRFIREELYETAVNFLRMGIQLPEHDAPVVEIGAYSSLVGSSIVGRIQINPDDILVLKDVDSTMFTEAIAIDVNEQNQCVALHKHNYPVTNTLFDGQALIDYSIFPEWGNGYILLRHHFFKAAAFKTNIQGFFQDYFGDSYRTATVTDMFGNKHLASNIKLITTNNALKFLKLGITYDYWCNWVRDNGCMFGIVKTAHPSKLGDVQRMSYQMVNTLDMETMDVVMAPSINYIRQLKSDINVYCDYLRRTANFSNDHEVLLALYEQDHTFEQSEYFRQRKRDIIRGYVWNLKNGKLIQNGDNLVIVGSPYAMLLHSVGEDALQDPTFAVEDDAVQCYTGRFVRGEYLAAFRQPFNSQNNLNHMHNVYHPYFDKYFDLGSLVIAVNMVGTSFQNRNNGSD